jgi:hypothetical protein
MKKFLTPLFLLSVFGLLFAFYLIFFIDETGWGTVAGVFLIMFSIVSFVIDFFLKKGLKSFVKIIGIEFLIIGMVMIALLYREREKTLIVNDSFDSEYISIIYGVENESGLSIKPWNWTKEIFIPENGLLYTSSDFRENLPKTDIRFMTKKILDDDSAGGFYELPEMEFESNGKVYKFRTWKIQKEFCCSWSTEETDSLEIAIKKQFERKKPAGNNVYKK